MPDLIVLLDNGTRITFPHGHDFFVTDDQALAIIKNNANSDRETVSAFAPGTWSAVFSTAEFNLTRQETP
ncbi:hypothetical protein [Corynebacterium parakroppenstedtii]|uniref:hypothetical protein n=1 Tax=Corynebacterium parakroppenstedtii TaxID=2828363 RepID=UPI001F26744E|nr:hypothetical protein [Corynebacterium parakroppenstedtii]MCF8713012.1 hypothetical protein [Corynebacterium parakroppenstedtii]